MRLSSKKYPADKLCQIFRYKVEAQQDARHYPVGLGLYGGLYSLPFNCIPVSYVNM